MVSKNECFSAGVVTVLIGTKVFEVPQSGGIRRTNTLLALLFAWVLLTCANVQILQPVSFRVQLDKFTLGNDHELELQRFID